MINVLITVKNHCDSSPQRHLNLRQWFFFSNNQLFFYVAVKNIVVYLVINQVFD